MFQGNLSEFFNDEAVNIEKILFGVNLVNIKVKKAGIQRIFEH
jgi:hypothetical protein